MRLGSAIYASFVTALVATPAMADRWMPEAAAQTAHLVDRHFTILVVFAASVFVGLLFALDVLVFMNLRKEGETPEAETGGDRPLYRAGAVVAALVLAVAFFAMGVDGYVDASLAPTDAMTVEAHGSPEGWSFRYSADVEVDELHLPTERPVRLTLHADEAAMALAIPAFRVRRNVKAGTESEAWFQASEPGSYAFLSSGPSLSLSPSAPVTLTVHSSADFDAWLMSKSDVLLSLPPVEAGAVLLERKGCLVCHTIDGSPLTGPTFLGAVGRESRFTDGTSVIVDLEYVRQSILDPNSRVVEGFEPVMTPFAGNIRDAEIDAIFAYLETLSEAGGAP